MKWIYIGVGLLMMRSIFGPNDSNEQPITTNTGVSLNQFVQMYTSGSFEKIVYIDATSLVGYEKYTPKTQTGGLSALFGMSQSIASGSIGYRTYTTNKPIDSSLQDIGISLTGSATRVEIEYNKKSFLMSLLTDHIVPLLIFLGLFWVISGKMKGFPFGLGSIGRFSIGGVSNGEGTVVTFKDVIGMEGVKQELQEIVDFLRDPKKYHDAGARAPKGILLYGQPGTGKTLLAKAVAGESGVPFFSVSGSEFTEMIRGMGASKVRNLFDKARSVGKAIIFIDEIDTVGKRRKGSHGNHEEEEQTLNQILTEMDGFDSDVNVIIMAATNMIDVLDPALLRSGRFDRKIYIPSPSYDDRKNMVEYYLSNKKVEKGFNTDSVIVKMHGMSPADIENIVNEAAVKVVRDKRKKMTIADMEYAIEKITTSKTGESRSRDKRIGFGDVIGMQEVKDELMEVVDMLKHPHKYTKLGAKVPKGVLLYGQPGTGKTLLAKAVATESDAAFFPVSGSEFVEKYVGTGAAKVRELFGDAKSSGRAIIFIDEIDAIGGKRGGARTSSEDDKTLNEILTQMDGFSEQNNVIVVAATNRLDTLDPALLRSGRFDRKILVNVPTQDERTALFEYYLRDKAMVETIDISSIVKRSSGMVGADVATIVNEAILNAAKQDHDGISNADMNFAIEKVAMGPERKSKVLSEEKRILVAYHELGHAVCSHFLPHARKVERITIVPRGMSLGATWYSLDEDDNLVSKEYFLDEMVSLLGGRAAEELFIGSSKITTGASNDFERATKIASHMVMKYGMDEEMGPVVYREEEKGHYRPLSTATIEKADLIIKKLVMTAYEQAKKILSDNTVRINHIKDVLLDKEYLSKEEFEGLMVG